MTIEPAAVLVSIGNSRTACAAMLAGGVLADVRRSATSAFDAGAVPGGQTPVHLISVVEDAARQVVAELRRGGRPVTWWGDDRDIAVRHPYAPPFHPGADRLVAALAAFRRAGRACVVVDAGTALTVDAVGPDGAFLGGAIAPGFATLAEGLRARAPALPKAGEDLPAPYPARSTTDAVSLGVHAAFGGALRELAAAANALLGKAPVFVTGGDAVLARRELARLDPVIVPELVLEGLALLAGAG